MHLNIPMGKGLARPTPSDPSTEAPITDAGRRGPLYQPPILRYQHLNIPAGWFHNTGGPTSPRQTRTVASYYLRCP